MITVNCPACAAPVKFVTAVSVFAVCPYCRSTLVRHDLDVQKLGTMAVLKDDFSPLQLGTQGTYESVHFVLAGRIKKTWSQGSWNEWFMWFDDAKQGWMSEAQGFYSVCFQASNIEAPIIEIVQPGAKITIGQREFVVGDIRPVSVAYSEGELPFKAEEGTKSTSVDLTSGNDSFACIEYSEAESIVSIGRYLKFEELKLSFLREIDGW